MALMLKTLLLVVWVLLISPLLLVEWLYHGIMDINDKLVRILDEDLEDSEKECDME